MATDKKYTKTLAGQSIFDLAVQLYGASEGVAVLLEDNPSLNLNDAIAVGTEVAYFTSKILNKDVVDVMNKGKFVPAFASTITAEVFASVEEIDFPDTDEDTLSVAVKVLIYGRGLSSDVTVTVPSGFIINLDGGTSDDGPITIEQVNGEIPSTFIYVRFAPTAVSSYSGNLTVASTGATTLNIALSGTGLYVYQPETIAYLTAISVPNSSGTVYYPSTPQQVTGAQIWTYVEEFFLEMKGQGTINSSDDLLGRVKAMYLFVGGTAAAHKFNAVNPLDTNAAFRATFVIGGTHSAFGYAGNGSSAYMNSKIRPNTDLILNDVSIVRYNNVRNAGYDCGISDTSNSLFMQDASPSGNVSNAVNGNGLSIATETTNPFVALSRRNSTEISRFANNAETLSTVASSAMSTEELVFLALNTAGVGVGNYSSNRTCFRLVGASYTLSELQLLEQIVTQLQTNLNRA